MLHNHHQHACSHYNVKHCQKCDVVYCESCGKEWGKYQTTYTPFYGGIGINGGIGGLNQAQCRHT